MPLENQSPGMSSEFTYLIVHRKKPTTYVCSYFQRQRVIDLYQDIVNRLKPEASKSSHNFLIFQRNMIVTWNCQNDTKHALGLVKISFV